MISNFQKAFYSLCFWLTFTIAYAQTESTKNTAPSSNSKYYCFDPSLSVKELEAYIGQISEQALSKECEALAYFRLGELDEQQHNYTNAVQHYRQVLLIDPSHWRAAAAQMRIQFIESNQSALSLHQRFETLRSKPTLDAYELSALAQETFNIPSAYIRDSIILSIITLFFEVLKQPELSIKFSLALARGSQASIDPNVRTQAYEFAYDAMLASNDWAQIQRELLSEQNISASLRKRIYRDQRRFWLHRITQFTLLIFACSIGSLFVLCLYQRRWAQWLRHIQNKLVWIFISVATLGGFLIAEIWQHNSGILFLRFGLFLILSHIWLSTWQASIKPQHILVKLGSLLMVVSFTFAAAYWALEHTMINGIPMLDEFGL